MSGIINNFTKFYSSYLYREEKTIGTNLGILKQLGKISVLETRVWLFCTFEKYYFLLGICQKNTHTQITKQKRWRTLKKLSNLQQIRKSYFC